MSTQPLLSVSSTSRFLTSPTGVQFLTSFNLQLPLRNVHWKSSSLPTLRTIQELDVIIVPLEHVRDEHASQIPMTLLEKPLLNIFIASCENGDLDTYRTTVKKQIKDWQTMVTSRRNQEWLIIHVVPPDSKLPTGKLFQLKGSVLDRIRADFNIDKRDRCVQLAWAEGSDNPQAWAEVLSKIKDGVLSSFDVAVSAREEELSRSEGQKQMPGWNFCSYFMLKESLAGSFDGFHLFEDALTQYDELDSLFNQVVKEKNLSWFGNLIAPTPKDDSSALLSVSKKPYRDFIIANTISVFDLRTYLLARQCALLARLGRLSEITRRCATFLATFGRRLREVETTIPKHFVESWTYSSALSVVDQCDAWASEYACAEATSPLFLGGKGELVELARHQLDTLGVRAGHLPSQPPFSLSLPPEGTQEVLSPMKISRMELLSALEDKEAFYDLYVSITNRAIDLYAKANRRKFAIKMHGSLAALDLYRGRLDTALTTYKSLPAHYAPHMWNSMESFMLARALDTHKESGQSPDVEWIHLSLAFLKAFVETNGGELLIHEDEKVEYLTRLVEELKNAAENLQTDLKHPDHPALMLKVSNIARNAGDQDGSYLDATIINKLSCALPVNRVEISLAGQDGDSCHFNVEIDELLPGANKLALFCSAPAAGTFALKSSMMYMSKLIFTTTYRKAASSAKHKGATPILVRLPRDPHSLDVQLHRPRHLTVGSSPLVSLGLTSGRNDLESVTITISSAQNIKIQFDKAKFEVEDEGVNLEPTPTSLELKNVLPERELFLLLPYSDSSSGNVLKAQITVKYETKGQPHLTRTLSVNRTLATSLPVSVNVEDFFRGPKVLSKFIVSTTSHQHVRIRSTELQPRDGSDTDELKITKGSSRIPKITTVTPSQPASFLFSIEAPENPVIESLDFNIAYRMLREEVEHLVKHYVQNIPLSRHDQDDILEDIVQTLESDASWVQIYEITDELHVPPIPVREGKDAEYAGVLNKLLETLRTKQGLLDCPWQTIRFPVDIPRVDIVAAARVTLSSEKDSLYAGQPIQATLSVATSLHWGRHKHNLKYSLRYDVQEVVRDWLISGNKRGDFQVEDGGVHTVPITLIALRHGEMTLPKVSVRSLPLAGKMMMGSVALPTIDTHQVHGAEKVLVLPRGGRSTYVVNMQD